MTSARAMGLTTVIVFLIGLSIVNTNVPVILHLSGGNAQAVSRFFHRIVLAVRYEYHTVDPTMVWNGKQSSEPKHSTFNFLSSIVLSTDSPDMYLFARFDKRGPYFPLSFDISSDGGEDKTFVWPSALRPLHLKFDGEGEHVVKIRANPLTFREEKAPFPLQQNVVVGFSIRRQSHLRSLPGPAYKNLLVTVTDSLGQGFKSSDPPRDAWTAKIAKPGRWDGSVVNEGFVGARLSAYCENALSCEEFVDALNRNYPTAAAYYFALGINDFDQQCIALARFAENYFGLLNGIHQRNPHALIYLQTPLHRVDENKRNRCGNILQDFHDAESVISKRAQWVVPVDGFAPPFPTDTSNRAVFKDGLHLTSMGQDQYARAVLDCISVQRKAKTKSCDGV